MNLIDFFQEKINLSEDILRIVDNLFGHEEYPRGSIFLKPDNKSKRLIFLEKGLYRTFYYKDGKDVTHHFWDENSFNCPIESVIKDEIAPYGWQAIEDCEVRVIEYGDFEKLMTTNSELFNLMVAYVSDMASKLSSKRSALNFKTAEEKYQDLTTQFPKIVHRVPLGHLASYMGMTQQTLSVLRGKK